MGSGSLGAPLPSSGSAVWPASWGGRPVHMFLLCSPWKRRGARQSCRDLFRLEATSLGRPWPLVAGPLRSTSAEQWAAVTSGHGQ